MKDYAGRSRTLRKKHSKTYVDGMSSSDEEDEMTTFDPEEKVRTKDYPPYFVAEMKGEDVTFEHFQRTGFNNPIFVKEKTGLQIRVPDSSFSVSDVKNLVGGKRILEVMNCATQLNAEMTLKDFEEFFTDPDRDDTKLNVISLEFSHTRLDAHVSAPRVIRQIDFTDNIWPRHLKDQQDDSTNDMSKMFYPKIQKYCLMSIEGCYTDFHVDLGGTSVWYHLLRGQKIFWLIPPSVTNLKAFENWTLSGKQGEVFFGDMVEKCGRVILNPGNTFFIPSGWIHAVYTPVDSLVFGGNYLHPFALERQIKIAQVEETLKVPQKFRFPFFTEMLWYMLDKYCYALLGRHHLEFDEHILTRLLGTEEERKTFQENIGHPHITQQEVRGLKATVLYLHSLQVNKKNVPSFIKDPVSLIRDIRIIVEVHKNDRPDRSLNGRPLLFWPGLRKDASWFTKGKRKILEPLEKQKRIEVDDKMYLHPACICSICTLDGWFIDPKVEGIERNHSTNSLMECEECCELVHFICLPDFGNTGAVRKESCNLWKCASCIRFPKKVAKLEPSEDQSIKKELIIEADNSFDLSKVKDEPQPYSEQSEMQVDNPVIEQTENIKQENTQEGSTTQEKNMIVDSVPFCPAIKEEPSCPATNTIYSKVESFFRRNGENFQMFNQLYSLDSSERTSKLLEDRKVLLRVFANLSTFDLLRCRSVCRTWNKHSYDKALGSTIDLSGLKITSDMINNMSNIRPEQLMLDWTNVGKQQLSWLLPKIQTTKALSLVGLEYFSQVSALASPSCPNLVELDLSFVTNLSDAALNKLIVRTEDKKSNLAGLRRLSLSNTEITDVSMRYISQQLQNLSRLSVAGCQKVTDAGLVQVGDPALNLSHSLVWLNMAGCKGVTDSGLVHVSRCTLLQRIDCLNTSISANAISLYLQIRADLTAHNFTIYQKCKP